MGNAGGANEELNMDGKDGQDNCPRKTRATLTRRFADGAARLRIAWLAVQGLGNETFEATFGQVSGHAFLTVQL